MSDNIREIPYNYTSYSDKEIVIRFLGENVWEDLNVLRHQRRTGRSARMLFEILGDVWVVSRNAFLKHQLLNDAKSLRHMRARHQDRLKRIDDGAKNNQRARKVIVCTEHMLDRFYNWFSEEPVRRRKARRAFAKFTHPNNIHFDAFTLTHHATDATDWRSHHPFCVLTPDTPEELAGLIRTTRELGLSVIPRGGGTGLCGGSVPLSDDCVMINVEKLDQLGAVEYRELEEHGTIPVITAQAGVVTGKVMEASKPHVFATDPTSLWACTIGGNVASNAGGKHALIWGTCIDNLLSWKMVTPDGNWLLVERLNHNMATIPTDREVQFRLTRWQDCAIDGRKTEEILTMPGDLFRRNGVGKDVTRKALGGLPGIQKEGTDGFITEATFVLHRTYAFTRTVCCEFFGADLKDATQSMVNIKNYADALSDTFLEGFEHFDEKYVKAINYISKSTRRDRPRVVLLIDVSGDNEAGVAKLSAEICRMTSLGNGEAFVAINESDRHRFWGDRGRMAAIAKHTRAFKLNEDVVIPLPRLSEYNDYVERLNIECSIGNKLCALKKIEAFLRDTQDKIASKDQLIIERLDLDDDAYLNDKLQGCIRLVVDVQMRWKGWLHALDVPLAQIEGMSPFIEGLSVEPQESLFRAIQRGAMRISYKSEVQSLLVDHLRGHDPLIQEVHRIHKQVLSGRIVVATHMHAGDGNVHTNIPVNSNDYNMMKQAHHVVEKIMARAEALDGVISGEHGIGITKLPYLNRKWLQEVDDYLHKVDPDRLFNRGKLSADTDLRLTYTPSFNLLGHESVILEAADLTELSEMISPCLRCGKCKPVCNTHFPRANMLYSPRNKIQAAGSIIEAFLYESQTGDGISFEQFSGLRDISDHCTICHKCESPCPVNIDFGDVTERMRALLKDKGQNKFNLGSKISLAFLVMQHPDAIHLVRKSLIRWGYKAHAMMHQLAKRLHLIQSKPAAKRNLDGVQAQVINFIERPLPGKKVPYQTTREVLGIESRDKNMIPVLRDPKRANGRSVFYFPGCGSERLFSQIGLATQAMLYEQGLNVVLPPSYLCCGYPSTSSGDHVKGDAITYENRVLFHRLRNALSYLDFEAVIVSCGTCYDQLTRYQLAEVFPDAPLIDIHEYLAAQGVSAEAIEGKRYMYHEPCHTPMKRNGSGKTIEMLLNQSADLSPQCCGEAGTLAVASPVIAGKIRARKEEEIAKASQDTQYDKILTSCPSCYQGLSRLEGDTAIEADYIVIELARRLYGENWQEDFVKKVRSGGIERILM
ncbi:MAG: DUF3683 domain-containing protein [Zetaproteobacteria bacterium]|nr:DUF3683 domain-containing protein [Zetaproteobacteria bacterium]